MKILKKIFYGLLIFIGAVLAVATFLPSTYKIERSMVVDAPADTVYSQVADLNRWMSWNPWTPTDPEAKNTITGNGVGQTWEWNGKKVGNGSLTITKLDPNRSVGLTLTFKDSGDMTSTEVMSFERNENKTKVVWTDEGHLDWPLGRVFGLFLDGMLGPHFEKGLENLKAVSENKK